MPPSLDLGPALALLDRLIAFDTVSARSNLALIDWVAAWLHGHGVEPVVLPSPDGAKANLYATIGPDGPGGVVLSGHTDVVPVTDQSWDSDPFVLTERDGRLYGRGTADMKGFLALALALVPALAARRLAVPVHLAFSYDEELGCLGVPALVRHVVQHLPLPRLVIIGEPTLMQPVNAHKGVFGFRTTVTGKDGHSSLTHIAASAIRPAAAIAGFLYDLADEKRAEAEPGSGFEPPYTTFNIGTIAGGTALNIVPRSCTMEWEFRPLPGEDPAAILARIEHFIAERVRPDLVAQHPAATVETVPLCAVPPLRPDPDGPAETLVRHLTGSNAAGVVPFGTEAGVFQQAGISAVVIGPGDITLAHRPNEYITRGQLAAGAAFLDRLAAWVETGG